VDAESRRDNHAGAGVLSATSGGSLRDGDATSYRSIQNDLIQMSENGNYLAAINHDAAGRYPGCGAHFTVLQEMLETYELVNSDRSDTRPFTDNELNFLDALVQIMARMNGLTITGHATQDLDEIDSTYSLHVRSNNCWSIDHWAIGIRPAGTERMYVQTVPNVDLQHNCDAVWDEHRAIAHFKLLTLLPAHVKALERVQPYQARRRATV
jgi:hypothetical protein